MYYKNQPIHTLIYYKEGGYFYVVRGQDNTYHQGYVVWDQAPEKWKHLWLDFKQKIIIRDGELQNPSLYTR